MANIEYILKSDSNVRLSINEKYAKKAQELIDIALNSKDKQEFLESIFMHDYFTGAEEIPGIADIPQLKKIGAPQLLKIQDSVYLTAYVDIYEYELINKDETERANALNEIEAIKKVLFGLVEKK